MKTRIIALILTVVMSLLALASCGSFNFAEEDLTSYATFDYEAFKKALQTIEIEDGDFTTDEATREKLVQSKIYNAVADKIITATYESDRKVEGALGKGDVLYFVYYATDADGKVYFTSHMNESAITTSSTKADHVIKLGETNEEKDLFVELKKALTEAEIADIKDYIYSMVTSSDLTGDELKVKADDVIVISYTRTHTDAEGTVVTESAAYETITLNDTCDHILVGKFLEEGAEAKVGSNLKAVTGKNDDGTVTTAESFDIEIDGTKYNYSNVKVQWKVENAGKEISFKYTFTESNKQTPDGLHNNKDEKIDLKDKELTYHVYPVYAVAAPAFEEITAVDILVNVYGSSLKETSFEAFEDKEFKNGDKTLADLIKDVANIYDTKTETNEVYKEGTELKTLLDAYNKAVEDGGDKPTTEQQKAIDSTKEALTKAQRKALIEVASKIAECKSGDKVLGTEIFEEYEHNTEHSLKEAYDSDITEKVQAAVWKLILDSVKVNSYPEKLVKEYVDHLHESYEYEYYKGNYTSGSSTSSSTTVKNTDKYKTFNEYLIATLNLTTKDKLNKDELQAALEKEAKGEIETIIKIYVVAKACEADALAVLPEYVEADIAGGAYNVHEESYRDAYGDKADEKIEEAKKNAEENIASAREDADLFIISDEYMKEYKKEVGRAYYRDVVEQYGEINIRAGFQFNRLFYYLTSTNIELNEDGDHTEVKYADGKLDFRTVSYTIKAETDK